MKSVLVLVPHCDDEILGCGGAIQYHIDRGDNVSVCFVKSVYDIRSKIQKKDSLNAKAVLNYSHAFYLNIKPKNLTSINAGTLSIIEKFISDQTPDILYTTHPVDTHQDHKAVYDIVKIVTRTYSKFLISQILCCETISSTNTSIELNNPFIPNYYIHLTENQIKNKIHALRIYNNELRPAPHPRSEEGIFNTAKYRGQACGSQYAEAFVNIRTILN
jgi:LmbE family N-acetylglucosaminyl deacetylase